jgi:probable HAF family extracellular repeat protein
MGTKMGFWVGVVLGLSALVSAVSNYDITLPNYPPGEALRYPSSLNDASQIVGPATSFSPGAYLWQNGTITSIPIPSGMFGSAGTDVNNAGHVVGGNISQQGALWDGSQIINLGTLGGGNSMPFALNESDQVVGSSQTSVTNQIRPFLWQNGVMTSLGSFGGNCGLAYDINNPGVIVGFSNNASDDTRAFIYRSGVMTDLGTLGGSQSNAIAINDANEVVGWSQMASGYQHAFIWKNGVMTDLGTLGGNQSQAFDINDSGQILGWAETATGYRPLVIWENGAAVRLNSLIAADSGWELVLTESLNMDGKPNYCINNNGVILGSGVINGSTNTFLMFPRAEAFFMHDGNGDGVVDLLDFSVMSEEWLK